MIQYTTCEYGSWNELELPRRKLDCLAIVVGGLASSSSSWSIKSVDSGIVMQGFG